MYFIIISGKFLNSTLFIKSNFLKAVLGSNLINFSLKFSRKNIFEIFTFVFIFIFRVLWISLASIGPKYAEIKGSSASFVLSLPK
ncbi:MAG: hypothetical protein ACTSQP_19590 [Promethearchaeota archaeon]